MNRFKSLCIIGAITCLITGCGFLPEEEEVRTAPIVSAFQEEEYKCAVVERGDIQKTENLTCQYQPSEEEVLSFSVGGSYYGNIYVKAGDKVKAGELLAELEMDSILTAIEESQLSIKKLELQINYTNSMIEIENKQLAITNGDSSNSQAIKNYEDKLLQLNDQLYISKQRLAEKEKLKKERQIYAGMDGIVSYVKVTKSWDRSVEDEKFIIITDSSLSFKAKTKNANVLKVGNKVEILVNNENYETMITNIGEKDDSGVQEIKFELTTPAANLPQGARGSYTLVLEKRKSCLYLPAGAVIITEDNSIVYGFDKDGLKTIKPVDIGLYADGKYEILSGLEEGEKVILN